jgi:hypothetical protein
MNKSLFTFGKDQISGSKEDVKYPYMITLQKDANALIYLCSFFRDEFDDVFSHAWSAGLFSQYELSFNELKGPSS